MRENVHTLVFAALLALVCSVALVGASRLTRPYRQANAKAERERNFLKVLKIKEPPHCSSKQLNQIFAKNVREVTRKGIQLYEYIPESAKGGKPVAVAVPFTGAGIWGEISGIVALDPDLETIRDISFYKEEETPGLGGEIRSDWFEAQFKGHKLVDAKGVPGFLVFKAGSTQHAVNAVDGITGATLTSDRIQAIMTKLAKDIASERNAHHDG